MIVFVWLLLCYEVSGVCSQSHTLQFYFSLVSDSFSHFYSVVAQVDDIKIGRYTSDTRRAQPYFQWMNERIEPEHWENQTLLAKKYEDCHKKDMQFFKGLFNKTHGHKGPYVYQVKFACEVHKDGRNIGYEEFGVNGKEFIVFDKPNMVFVPVTQEAQIVSQVWNSQQYSAIKHKIHMEQDCVQWINKYLTYGRSEFERKVRPHVKISSRESDSFMKLRCQVYGFYPRDVDVKWVKNGVDDVYSEEAKQILPNPDGTYQIRVTVEVTPKEGDSYACYVDHSSLEKPLILLWEPKKNSRSYIADVVAVGFVLVVVGLVYKFTAGDKRSKVDTFKEGEHGSSL